MRILVAEDDIETGKFLVNGLCEQGHSVELVSNGEEALSLSRHGAFDVIVLDRMLPVMDGLTVLKTLRKENVYTPIIFLTAMGSLEDRVKGLESGGDDYLVKPFAFAEFHARVCSLARRPPIGDGTMKLKVSDLEIDQLSRSVSRAGKSIDLQPTEFRLLEFLMKNTDRVVTRTMLLEAVWQFNFDPKTNIVETHVSRLRAKVDRGFERELIKTIRGEGYKIHA